MQEEILRFSNVHTCIDEAAEFIYNKALGCINEKGRFTMALSGGATPKVLYETLAKEPYIHRIPWDGTHLFWSDERFVSHDHPDSNYAMAYRTMISHVPIPEANVHPVPVSSESVDDAASKYERHLREFFSGKTPSPCFDLILLGLGNDGHAASLYPGSPALSQKDKWVDVVPKPGIAPFHPRITMTLPFINNAGCVLFLVTGPKKRDIVERIVGRFAGDEKIYPAAMIKPSGQLVWFLAT
jgi:6-phosphogluconolactonase